MKNSINKYFKTVAINRQQDRNYVENLDIEKGLSYFEKAKEPQDKEDYIKIETCVNKETFEVKGAYYYNLGFMHLLCIHIYDKKPSTQNNRVRQEKRGEHILEGKLPISQINCINSINIELDSIDQMHVVLYNNESFDPNLEGLIKIHPEEAGGGVIVTGP